MKSLSFESITFGYQGGKVPIFKDLNLQIEATKGHVVALMGASGSGKSTLFKLILQTEKPEKGSLKFHSSNPIIAYLPQEPVLFEHLTPMQNARYFQRSAFYKSHFKEDLFSELISSLNIQDVLENSRSILELSGGQRQRLSLLRSLSIQPDILLLDEPTNGLDAAIKLQFLNKLREIVLKYNLLVIYITHHKLETELIADEVVYLSAKNNTTDIHRKNILNFIEQPPLLEALEVFNYPKPNILMVKIENNNAVPVDNEINGNVFYLGLTEDKVLLSDNGMEYEVITSNPVNTVIKFKNCDQYMNLSTHKIPKEKHTLISFKGTFNIYNLDGEFSRTLTINNNI